MSIRAIQDRLDSYGCASTIEEEQALREITQEIVLAALGRTSFFDKAAFQGGTCLRIFHGVNRFSEDLDFALRKPDRMFELGEYLKCVVEDLKAFGYQIEIDDRGGLEEVVKKAFLKDDSIGHLLNLGFRPKSGPLRKIRIKFEVDSNPPLGATYEVKVMDFPFPAAVSTFDLPDISLSASTSVEIVAAGAFLTKRSPEVEFVKACSTRETDSESDMRNLVIEEFVIVRG